MIDYPAQWENPLPGQLRAGAHMTNEVFASGLRKEGFFEKLDLAQLPNYADLYPMARATDGWGAIGSVSPIGIGFRTAW